MNGVFDDLRLALEACNESTEPERGERLVHQAVTRMVRDRRALLKRQPDLEDVCQEVEIAIALAMRERRRKVIDVLKMISTIVERKIIDANGRRDIDDAVVTVDDDRWESLERTLPSHEDGTADVHVELLLGKLPGLTERDRVALRALCDGHDAEGIRLALERHTRRPVTANAAKQALFRARTRLKGLTEEGMV